VEPWSADRIWDAVDAWRWIPPGATRSTTDEYEIAVTPGSYSLTYVYGVKIDDPHRVGPSLRELRERIAAMGGTGARVQITPRSRPPDIDRRLVAFGYLPREETEVLVWELRDSKGGLRIPNFPPAPDAVVREVTSEREFDSFVELSSTIFGDPPPPAATRAGFLEVFHRNIRESGHSERFLAWRGGVPVGRAGLELVGPVARFWGTGVLPEHRRTGVYGALVRARCELAASRGGEIALVTARVGTSGPILKKHGFRSVGSVRVFETRW
jgi:GNAT superfamily N-acetyltransferase